MHELSRGVELLVALLETGGPEAKAVKSAVHRSQINNYRALRRKPSMATAFALERVSGGRLPASSWSEPPKARKKRRTPEPSKVAS